MKGILLWLIELVVVVGLVALFGVVAVGLFVVQ